MKHKEKYGLLEIVLVSIVVFILGCVSGSNFTESYLGYDEDAAVKVVEDAMELKGLPPRISVRVSEDFNLRELRGAYYALKPMGAEFELRRMINSMCTAKHNKTGIFNIK